MRVSNPGYGLVWLHATERGLSVEVEANRFDRQTGGRIHVTGR